MKNFQRASLACSASVIAALCIIAPASAATVANTDSPKIERVSETADIVFPQVSSQQSISAPAAVTISFERPVVTTVAAPPPVVVAPAPEAAPQSNVAAPQAAAAQTSQGYAAQAPVAAQGRVQAARAAAPAPVSAPVASTPVAAPVAHGSGLGAGIAAAALSQIGVEQDCTALVSNSLRAVGINFHSAPAGYLSLGTIVSAAQAQPGDLVYYANGGGGQAHIAVYIGGGKAVHGGWEGHTTKIFSVNVGSGPTYIHIG